MNGAGAAACGTRQGERAQDAKQSQSNSESTSPTPTHSDANAVSGVRVLAEGEQSRVDDAFVAVARDAETYTALRELAGQLPELNADFFKTNAVIAAFLGQRRTGGYSVQIERTGNTSVRVASASPAADAMLAQVMTAPFKVVSVATGDGKEPLTVELDETWKMETRPYRVTTGEFIVAGSSGGREEKLRLEGDIRILHYGELATFAFDLKGVDGMKSRALKGVATGVVQTGGRVSLAHVDAGSLVDSARIPLRATGKFINNEDSFSLVFESLPPDIADGFSGKGKLEAVATTPSPQR